MFIHPLVAIFMMLWLGIVGHNAFRGASDSPIVWGMFVFGIALTVVGFAPEALKARRLLSEAMHDATVNSLRGRPTG
jgi:hypothetical protein